MAEIASLWGYEENHEMEQLGQKLLFTTLELEKLKSEAMEEMRKNKDYIKQLIRLLKFAIQERDEARNQLHKLINNSNNKTSYDQTSLPNMPLFQQPPQKPANSSITESNSLSDTYNYHSSPVESLFDAVSSPEFSNMNTIVASKIDSGSLIIENLVKGKSLPQKGKFLQAVLQAGPLLQTLLVAGPLPRWRNPPQLQPFQIPPVSIKSEVFAEKNVGQLGSRTANSQTYNYGQMSCAPAQVQSMNFGNLGSGNCFGNGSLISSGMNFSNNSSGYAVPLAKRQRFS